MRKTLLAALAVAALATPAFAQTQGAPRTVDQNTVVMMSIEQVRQLMLAPTRPSERMPGMTTDQNTVVMQSLEQVRRIMGTAPGSTMVVTTPDVLDRLWSQRGG